MANESVGGQPLPFNIPTKLSEVRDRDTKFWWAHGAWRKAETAFDAWPEFVDECPIAAKLFDRANLLRDAMFKTPVHTASALLMKFEAMREGPWDSDEILNCGLTVGQFMEGDVERISKFEIWGSDGSEN